MFDIGFTELLLIGVVALVVVGPERLPGLIRTALGYIRQFKSSFSHIKSEVERELDLADLRKDLQDNKKAVGKAIGYDELNESLHELKRESSNLGDFSEPDDSDSQPEKNVDNETITQDLAKMEQFEGPTLPDPDAEKDTGIEPEPVADYRVAKSDTVDSQ